VKPHFDWLRAPSSKYHFEIRRLNPKNQKLFFLEKRAFLSTESENNIELEKKIEIRERQNGKIREQRNHEKSTSCLHQP